jgi:hypothetical protein
MKIRFLDQLEKTLLKYQIDPEKICIVGSSAMSALGIKQNKDIDIIMTLPERKAKFSSNRQTLAKNVELVSEGWLSFDKLKDDEIINNSNNYFMQHGFKIVNLSLLLKRKIFSNREKDIRDIQKIKEFLKESKIQ